MSGVPNQGHFYCSACFAEPSWMLYERSCKAKGIDGHFSYRCPTKQKAYKLRALLNKMYAKGMLSALERFRWYVSDAMDVQTFDMTYIYAEHLWLDADEVRDDDSRVMSAPIVGSFGG